MKQMKQMKQMKDVTIIILIVLFFASCVQNKSAKTNDCIQTDMHGEEKSSRDSVEIEKYLIYLETIPVFKNAYNIKIISDYEDNRDEEANFHLLKKNFSKLFDFDGFPYELKDLVQYTYQIDIDNDKKKDFIYQGPSGGELDVTVILMNRENSFYEVFRQYQNVFEMEFKDSKLSSISLTNPGCCADPQVVDYFYTVSYIENKISFELTRTTGYISGFENPQKRYTKEKQIVVAKNNVKLRSECYEFDIVHPIYGSDGNVLATYAKGSTGKVLAEKKQNGDVWIFVLMDSTGKFSNVNFPTFNEQSIELYGWIKKDETDFL